MKHHTLGDLTPQDNGQRPAKPAHQPPSAEAVAWLRYEAGDIENGQAWGQDADGRSISEYAAEILRYVEGR